MKEILICKNITTSSKYKTNSILKEMISVYQMLSKQKKYQRHTIDYNQNIKRKTKWTTTRRKTTVLSVYGSNHASITLICNNASMNETVLHEHNGKDVLFSCSWV